MLRYRRISVLGSEKKSIEMEWQTFHVFFFVIFAVLVISCDARRRCKCENGGRCVRRGTMCLCKAGGGFFGDRCELPCVDIYNSCKNWKEQGRCSYRYGSNKFFLENCPVSCRECTYNPQNAPKGVPLAPVLRPLKGLIGKWRAESDGTYRYPLPFSSTSGYVETIEVSIAKLPAFDTPYLLYSSTAKSKGKDGNVQSDLGFLWLKTKQNVTKIANMFTTNTGITVIQEGHLSKNVLNFTSTPYKQHLPEAMFGMFDFDVEVNRMFKFTANRLIQVVIDKERYFYQKVYERIE